MNKSLTKKSIVYFFSEEIDAFIKVSKIDLNMFKGDTSAIYDHKLEINPIKELKIFAIAN